MLLLSLENYLSFNLFCVLVTNKLILILFKLQSFFVTLSFQTKMTIL